MSEPFLQGNQIRVERTFKRGLAGADGVGDPSTVTYKYRKPGSTTVTSLVYGTDAEVVRDSTGVYHVDLELDTAGIWTDWWVTTGQPDTVSEETFSVRRARYA